MAPTEEFCGIDPDEMGQLATALRGAADRLTAFSGEFEITLRRHGISTPALREIAHIADWGGTQVSMLHNRIDLVRNLGSGAPELGGAAVAPAKCTAAPDGGGGGQGLIRLPDELEGFEFAQGLARMYGQDILVQRDSELQAALIHEHADEITRLADNPQAAAAFFALLPSKVRDALPRVIAATGSKTAKQDLAAFSKALGAALRAPALVPAFAKVRADLVKPVGGKVAAWNRLALLKGANAPSKVRVAAARALALDDFMKNPHQDWRGAAFTEMKAHGLSSDVVALALEVLAGDGTAVRDAFATMGGADVKLSRSEKMKRFLDYAKSAGTGDDVVDAFGRVMEAGAEVATEEPGKHSSAASAFALDTMLAAGPFGTNLPITAKDSMGVIARSYVHELVSGTRFDRAAYRASGFTMPEHWLPLPGVTPAFYLSPGDTYRFMRTFVGEEKSAGEFNATVARFRHDILLAAARLDVQSGTDHFHDISMMFGDFGSVAFKATKDVLGEEDAARLSARNFIKNTAGFALGRISPLNEIAALSWEVFQSYVFSSVSDNWAADFEKQVEVATGKRVDLARRMKFDMAHLLYSGGYPVSKPPQELISTANGTLKTYEEFAAEAKREATGTKKWEQVLQKKLDVYEDWMDENGNLDKKIEYSSRFQSSDLAENLLRIPK